MEQKDYIYGKNSCREALEKNASVSECLLAENFKDKEIINLLKKRHIRIKEVRNNYLDSFFKNVVHQGIALKVSPYKYTDLEDILNKTSTKKDALVVILDGLEDPHNLGAIIRSCDAFNVDGIIIPSNRSVSVTSTVVKISTGAIEYVPVCKVTNINHAIDILKNNGFWVVSSDGKADKYYDALDYNMKTALVIGSEGKGISPLTLKKSDFVVKIPMFGHVNSLNASVATGILLAMIAHKRGN